MRRILNIPLSVIIVYFSYVLLYFGTLGSMDPWLAIVGGAMIPIGGILVWFDFARSETDTRRRASPRNDHGS